MTAWGVRLSKLLMAFREIGIGRESQLLARDHQFRSAAETHNGRVV